MDRGFALEQPLCYSFATMAYEKLARMVNKETGEMYVTPKNKKKLSAIKFEFKKYSKKLRKVVTFKEGKK
jgi:ribosomal protein L33